MKITMVADDWRLVGYEAVGHAMSWLKVEGIGRSGHIVKAAELLQAAKTIHGHANMLDLMGEVDETEIEE